MAGLIPGKSDQDQERKEEDTQHFIDQEDDKNIGIRRPRDGKNPSAKFQHEEFDQVDGPQPDHTIQVEEPEADVGAEPGVIQQEAGVQASGDKKKCVQQ